MLGLHGGSDQARFLQRRGLFQCLIHRDNVNVSFWQVHPHAAYLELVVLTEFQQAVDVVVVETRADEVIVRIDVPLGEEFLDGRRVLGIGTVNP